MACIGFGCVPSSVPDVSLAPCTCPLLCMAVGKQPPMPRLLVGLTLCMEQAMSCLCQLRQQSRPRQHCLQVKGPAAISGIMLGCEHAAGDACRSSTRGELCWAFHCSCPAGRWLVWPSTCVHQEECLPGSLQLCGLKPSMQLWHDIASSLPGWFSAAQPPRSCAKR